MDTTWDCTWFPGDHIACFNCIVGNDKERAKSKEPTDDQLLHSIVKIIRNDIAKVEFSTEHDPTLTDASPSHSFHPM
jgi:hypothetical protein